jgi:hypothetical protein
VGYGFRLTLAAEVATENAPNARIISRVTELSLQGCFLKTPVQFDVQRTVILNISHSGDFFEANATVLYMSSQQALAYSLVRLNITFGQFCRTGF